MYGSIHSYAHIIIFCVFGSKTNCYLILRVDDLLHEIVKTKEKIRVIYDPNDHHLFSFISALLGSVFSSDVRNERGGGET